MFPVLYSAIGDVPAADPKAFEVKNRQPPLGFAHPKRQNAPNADAEKMIWGLGRDDALQALIQSCHPPESIGRYTLTQVRLYLAAIGRKQRRDLRDLLFVLRASQADKKGFNAAWKALGEARGL